MPRTPPLSLRQLVRRQVAGEVAALRDHGTDDVTFQPTADDLAVMLGDSMDPAKASIVLRQVVRVDTCATSASPRSPNGSPVLRR